MKKITLQNIRFKYDHEGEHLLENISLDFRPGEIVLLLGPTGSGKTTLLQILAGVTPQVTGGMVGGKALLDEVDILRTPGACRGRVGLVLQDPEAQLVNLTVTDEIIFGPENLKLSKEQIMERLDWALEKCRLTAIRDDYVYALSGGQKQRIAIAAGLAMTPEVLLLDGPLTNLDPQGAREVLQTIVELIETQTTQLVIISSNKIDALLPLATRVLVVDHGQIVMDGPPNEVLSQIDALEQIGLFIPEVVSLWPVVRSLEPDVELPKTAEQAVEILARHAPVLQETAPQATQSSETEEIIQVRDVAFSYGLSPVLTAVDLTVRRGEFASVVGQNGSGKSTLMSLITGLRTPDRGTIKIAGNDIQKVSPQGIVGYVFQYPEHQFVSDTVEKELRFGLEERFSPVELDSRVEEILTLFGMQDRREESPYTLSTGEKRMLSVASMLVLRPQVLILDEPTTGLDRHLTTNLMTILRRFVDEFGLTVVQVSHDMEQIAEFCSKAAVIDQGRVIFVGTPSQLFRETAVLHQAKLDAPVIGQIARTLFPGQPDEPVTVHQFLERVHYARH